MLNITSNIDKFIKEPFNPDMDLWNWAAFISVIAILAYLWYQVLNSIKSAL